MENFHIICQFSAQLRGISDVALVETSGLRSWLIVGVSFSGVSECAFLLDLRLHKSLSKVFLDLYSGFSFIGIDPW